MFGTTRHQESLHDKIAAGYPDRSAAQNAAQRCRSRRRRCFQCHCRIVGEWPTRRVTGVWKFWCLRIGVNVLPQLQDGGVTVTVETKRVGIFKIGKAFREWVDR